MRTISRMWEIDYPKLGEVNVGRPLDNALIKQTMRPWEYEGRAKEIVGRLKARDSILEIGCGYGGLAQEILKRISVSYTVVDNELMLIQARKNLGNKVTYIDAREIKTLRDKKFTLFISHACLSETPFEYREYVMKNITKNCQKISIIDFDDKAKPGRRMIKYGIEMLPAITEHYLNKYFVVKKTKRENCKQLQYIFIGERKK